MRVIGLAGAAGAGKDAVARIIARRHEVRFAGIRLFLRDDKTALTDATRKALADPLKAICKQAYDFSEAQLWGPSELRNTPDRRYPRPCTDKFCNRGMFVGATAEETTPCPVCEGTGITYLTPREALQRLGTEWGRTCWSDTSHSRLKP